MAKYSFLILISFLSLASKNASADGFFLDQVKTTVIAEKLKESINATVGSGAPVLAIEVKSIWTWSIFNGVMNFYKAIGEVVPHYTYRYSLDLSMKTTQGNYLMSCKAYEHDLYDAFGISTHLVRSKFDFTLCWSFKKNGKEISQKEFLDQNESLASIGSFFIDYEEGDLQD